MLREANQAGIDFFAFMADGQAAGDGFRRRIPDGKFATWVSVSNKAHEIAFVKHDEPGKLHHLAFKFEDWTDIGHAAAIMTQYDISRDLGPTRLGITRGRTIYFFDPSDSLNKVFASGYTSCQGHPPRVRDHNNVGHGILYDERLLTDAVLSVVT